MIMTAAAAAGPSRTSSARDSSFSPLRLTLVVVFLCVFFLLSLPAADLVKVKVSRTHSIFSDDDDDDDWPRRDVRKALASDARKSAKRSRAKYPPLCDDDNNNNNDNYTRYRKSV